MTAICGLNGCGEIIRPGLQRVRSAPMPGDTEEERRAARDLQEFDQLAHAVFMHIAQRHASQSQEMNAIGHLCMKVYAMRFVSSADPKHAELIKSWHAGIKHAMFPDQAATGAAAPPAGGPADAAGAGSGAASPTAEPSKS